MKTWECELWPDASDELGKRDFLRAAHTLLQPGTGLWAFLAFGRDRGWPFLEVGAPGFPRWHRTAAFYERIGFREIGPRLELEL